MRPSKALIAKWYKKANAKGSWYQDIENDKGLLKQWSGSPLPGFSFTDSGEILNAELKPLSSRKDYSSKLFKESQVEYYRLARQYLYDKPFPSQLHKDIWELHADGMSINAIKRKLKIPWHIVRYRIDSLRKQFYSTDTEE